jgi:superfamily II DNA or RNA helicase
MRTFGTVELQNGTPAWWNITCEPQVAIRLKRVFPKVREKEHWLRLADTPENARELAWFLQRYPMKVPKKAKAYLDQREQQHAAFSDDIGRILSGSYKPSKAAELAIPLREYQKVAVDLGRHTRGLLVGDDVGLGKTATAIGMLADPQFRPAIIVTLTHLCRQWEAEIKRFLPNARSHILKTGKAYPLLKQQGDLFGASSLDFVICNYHKLDGWADELAGIMKGAIFDEAHELRHTDSNKYRAAKKIAAQAGIVAGLTATPIFNEGEELFNVMEVIKPGALGSHNEFSVEWTGSGGWVKDPKAFGSYLREAGLMLRRTREEVGRELPGLSIIPHVFDVDFDEINKMTGDAASLARTILTQGGMMGIDKLRAAEEFSLRLRQATGIVKAPLVADFVRMLIDSGEKKVMVGGWHHEVYRLLRDRLSDPDGLGGDLRPVFFTGEETVSQKEEAKRRFVDGDSKVMVISVRAGAGIDGLQKVCRTVVVAEPDWSPAVHEQLGGRVHRDGQAEKVFMYFLLANCGSDPVVADVLGLKKAQLEGIRDPTAELIERSQVDPDKIKKLAADFLRQRGESVETTEAA